MLISSPNRRRVPHRARTAQRASAAEPGRLGLVGATALVVGSIVGVGIFNLPTSLAGYGPITLVSLGLTTIGALALAVMFASLSRRMPADGGPYAYARVAIPGAVHPWLRMAGGRE
jgi:basic amino acid/polyamine antiporter, APA family